MAVEDNWLANFKQIVRKEIADAGGRDRDGYKAVAFKAKLSEEYIYQMYQSKPKTDGTLRVPGKKTVAALSRAYGEGKRADWMDLPPQDEDIPSNTVHLSSDSRYPVDPQPEYAGKARPSRMIPVIGTARMGECGFYELVEGDGCLEIASDDPHAYGLRVRGDSMYPAIKDGWYVLVEPSLQPSQGEYVLIQLQDGQKMVKELMYRRADAIEVISVNDGARRTIDLSDLDSERGIQAIGAVVPPSKWKSTC